MPTCSFRRCSTRTARGPVSELLVRVQRVAVLVGAVPEVFRLSRDPDDAHYVNLASAVGADSIVTSDHDLLDLVDPSKPDAAAFQQRFPTLSIVTPEHFSRQVIASREPT